MAQPGHTDFFWNSKLVQSLSQNLQTAGKLSAHDWMGSMSRFEGASLVLNVCAKEASGELELQLLDPDTVSVTEKEADHDVVKDPVHKDVDDLTEAFSTDLVVQ